MRYLYLFLWLCACTTVHVIADKAFDLDIKFMCGSFFGVMLVHYTDLGVKKK